jgi:hypothetical protein
LLTGEPKVEFELVVLGRFVRSSLSESVALLTLLLKEIAFIIHEADLKQKMPRKSGAPLCHKRRAQDFVPGTKKRALLRNGK